MTLFTLAFGFFALALKALFLRICGDGNGDFFSDKELNVIRGTNITAPATLYMALFSVLPGEDGTGGTEIANAGNYARVAITCNTSNWTAPAAKSGGGRKITNAVAITFNPVTVNWATAVGWALMDSATWNAGNMYRRGSMTTPIAWTVGQTPNFDVNTIELAQA